MANLSQLVVCKTRFYMFLYRQSDILHPTLCNWKSHILISKKNVRASHPDIMPKFIWKSMSTNFKFWPESSKRPCCYTASMEKNMMVFHQLTPNFHELNKIVFGTNDSRQSGSKKGTTASSTWQRQPSK